MEKSKINKKRPGLAHFFKKTLKYPCDDIIYMKESTIGSGVLVFNSQVIYSVNTSSNPAKVNLQLFV